MERTADIAVIGRSIAGLATALVCADAGYQIVLIGQPAYTAGGLQLGPNSFSSLSKLSFGKAILSHAQPLESIQVSQLNTSAKLADLAHPDTRFYASISRTRLVQTLEELCYQQSKIRVEDTSVSAGIFTSAQPDAQLVCDEGQIETAPVVIGADGYSGFSRKYVSPAPIRKSAFIAFRAAADATLLPPLFSQPHTRLMLGPECHFVSYPFDNSTSVNLVFCLPEEQAGTGWKERYFRANPITASLLDAELHWQKTQLPDASTLPVWQHGRLTLIGDAAHSMPPHLAQGAGQTFEDIACLSHCLSTTQYGAETAFKACSEMAVIRARQTAPIVKKAGLTGQIMRAGDMTGRVRDILLDIAGETVLNSWMEDVWSTTRKSVPDA